MQRVQATLLSLAIGAGCAVDRIAHDEGPAGADGSAEGGGGEDEGTEERGGNFPEPALTICGQLPDGIEPIAGLASAYAVTGPRPPAATEEESPAPEALRIRLADWGIEPDEVLRIDSTPAEGEACEAVDAAGFAFDIPVAAQTVGVHDFAVLVPSFPEFFDLRFSNECAEGGEIGGGWAEPLAMEGELEIFFISDVCVVGEIRNASAGSMVWNGGFVAMRSALTCVPMMHEDAC